jgi:hypothetical protein
MIAMMTDCVLPEPAIAGMKNRNPKLLISRFKIIEPDFLGIL